MVMLLPTEKAKSPPNTASAPRGVGKMTVGVTGNQLKAARALIGANQATIAAAAGLTRQTIRAPRALRIAAGCQSRFQLCGLCWLRWAHEV
jgi:hypothetical protein